MSKDRYHRPKWSRGQRIQFWLITQTAGRLIRLIFRTCRVELINREIYDEYFVGGKNFVGVSWHRGGVYACHYFGHFRPAFMASRSKDGELAAGFVRLCKAIPVRGSSSSGGSTALRELERALTHECNFAATVADGPQGPPYVAKAGLALLASRTGLPLVPVMWSTDRAWIAKGSWDKQMIPKPFAKIRMAFGQPIPARKDMTNEEIELLRQEMEDSLNQVTRMVDELCGHQDPE